MEQEILKGWQKKVIAFLFSIPDFKLFYLTGGTALAAFYLKHRFSDDLDFFSSEKVDAVFVHNLAQKIKKEMDFSETRFSRIHDRYQFFYSSGGEELKIEFSHYPFKQLKEPTIIDGWKIDSEYDIAVNKLATILDRFDPKDFVDLYFLLPKFSLKELKHGAEEKFGSKIEPLFLGSELSNVRRITALPKIIKPLSINDLKEFFAEEIKKLAPEVIE